MARNKDLLTDKDFFRKTTDIVEHVRKCKIKITYFNDDNKVYDEHIMKETKLHGTNFCINIATPSVKGIEKFTALNHELGHVLMQTPMAEAKKLLTLWLMDKDGRKYNDANGQKKWICYWSIMNILEDQRIESMMSKLWLANEKRFIKARKNRGKMHETCKKNPVDILLNIRFLREDLAKKPAGKNFKIFKSALNDVVGTGRLGSLVLLVKLKPIIDSYFKTPKITKSRTEAHQNEMKVAEMKHKKEPLDGNDSSSLSDKAEIEDEDEIMDLANMVGSNKIDDRIGEEQKKGIEDISDIKDSMSEGDGGEKVPTYVLRVIREPRPYEVNTVICNGLKKVFKKITEMPKSIIGYDGDEVDIETYIENKIKGYDISKCFIDKRYEQGASILISIDGSGSMNNRGKIEEVRNIVATLFESVKDYPNIVIKANIWSSNGRGDVGMTDINNIEECKLISTINNAQCIQTPTHLALDYSRLQLNSMEGNKKLLIMITDGIPQYTNNGYTMKSNVVANLCKKSFMRVRRVTDSVMVIQVGGSMYGKQYLREIFGKSRIMEVNTMYMAGEHVVKEFRKTVLNVLASKA